MTIQALKPFILGPLSGILLGLVYWKFIGCTTGACPLTATPLRAMIYGGSMGLFWALLSRSQPG